MWLAKLFGGRRPLPKIDPDEEPARFQAPIALDATGTPSDFKARQEQKPSGPKPPSPKPPGFDPYNSGSFKKKDDAWVRVGRR